MFFNLFSALRIFKQEIYRDIPAVPKDLGFYSLKPPLYDMNGEARVHLNLNLQREVQTNYQIKNNINQWTPIFHWKMCYINDLLYTIIYLCVWHLKIVFLSYL